MRTLRFSLLVLVSIASVSAVFAGPNPQQFKHPHRTMRASAEAAKTSCEAAEAGVSKAAAEAESPKLKVVRQGKRTTVIKEEASAAQPATCSGCICK